MTSDAPSGGHILGTLRSADGKGVVRIEDRFDSPIADVWSAITDPGRLAAWLGEIEGDFQVNGAFRARFYASGWEGTGRIDACEAPRRLLVWTKDDEQPGERPIEVTLREDGDQTIVLWEERGLPLELLAAFGAGIQIHVEDLKDHLSGRERLDASARFEQLFSSYRELVPEAD